MNNPRQFHSHLGTVRRAKGGNGNKKLGLNPAMLFGGLMGQNRSTPSKKNAEEG
jgi:hypothetical protein